MFEFIEHHHNLIFNTLPAFFHNKWVIMCINLVFFYLLIKLCNFIIDKFAAKIIEYIEHNAKRNVRKDSIGA